MARTLPFLLFVASLIVVGTALLSQYWGGLQPCELCLYQRWFYYAILALTLLLMLVNRRGTSRAGLVLAGLVLIAGGAVAFYHAGVEYHYWAGPAHCTAPALNATSAEDLRAQLLATPVVRCDETQWSLMGISLAGWNVLASAVLAAYALIASRRLRGRR